MGADVPISIRQELANMKLDHANLIGQYNSQSELLKQREAELRQVEQEYSTTSDEISKLKLLVRNTEMKALRSERRSQAAQQEIALLKALVVREFHFCAMTLRVETRITTTTKTPLKRKPMATSKKLCIYQLWRILFRNLRRRMQPCLWS